MIGGILANKAVTELVLIDVYSTQAFWYFVLCAQLCRLVGIPYVPILHGGNLPERLKGNRWFIYSIFRQASLCISPSAYLKAAVNPLGIVVEVIPNSLDIKQYHFFRRRKFAPKLLWVRSFHRIYNPLLAVRLVHELTRHGMDPYLTMVGADKDGSRLEAEQLAFRLGVNDRVTFTGRLSKQSWIDLSTDSDIFINTTDFDNMPVSVIEAMALGLAVVSTNVGGLPSLIHDGYDGIMVPKDDSEAFVRSILRIVGDPDLGMKLAHNGRKKAESFAWEEIRPMWESVIQKHSRKL